MIEFRPKDFFHPHLLVHTYVLLRRSERWPRARLRAYQADRLARMIRYCAREVPYYRAAFPRLGIDGARVTPASAFDVLARIPLLDKDTLRSEPRAFLSDSRHEHSPKEITTSGTTGTPLTVLWDRESNVFELCSVQRHWRWGGARPGQCFLDMRSRIFSGKERHYREHGRARYTWNRIANGLEFSSDYIDDASVRDYHALLLRHRPRLVRGHPQAILQLALSLERNGLGGWRPAAVTTASEALYDFQRQAITRAWGVPVLDEYGLKEHNVFIGQCERGGYHVFSEYGICEIVDDAGKPVAPGEEGWIVATGLHNFAQSMLRYNTRDRAIAAAEGERCACGRTLPLVRRIVGRIDDNIVTRSGKVYSGMHFAFFGRRGIKKARLVQQSLERVLVELMIDDAFNDAERRALLDALETKVARELVFDVKVMDEIRQAEPGKFKFVVSELPPPANRAVMA